MYRVDLSVVAWTMPIDDAHLMAIFQDNLGKNDFELRMMEVVVTNTAIRCAKLQSNHHHKHTIIKHFTGWCPSCCATNSVRALKGGLIPINSEIFTTEQKKKKIGPQKLQHTNLFIVWTIFWIIKSKIPVFDYDNAIRCYSVWWDVTSFQL